MSVLCTLEDNSSTKISSSAALLEQPSLYIVETQPQLTLTNITAPTHGGRYDCIVLNDAGFGIDSATLYVHPTIVLDPMDTLTRVNETINLTCLAEGFPYPTYQWQMMDRSSGYYEDIPGETETVLTISPVQFDDIGRYRCVATNVIDGYKRVANSSNAHVTGKRNINFDNLLLIIFIGEDNKRFIM